MCGEDYHLSWDFQIKRRVDVFDSDDDFVFIANVLDASNSLISSIELSHIRTPDAHMNASW